MHCALYIINYPLTLVASGHTLPTFLSCHKKVGKRGQDCARFEMKVKS